jgi:hypothetical protein
LLVEYIVATNSKIDDTRHIVWEADAPLGKERTYRIEDTNGAVYLLKTDNAVLTEAFIDERIRQLRPLSSQQIAALDENKNLRKQRARVVKFSLIVLFVGTSFTGLYLYRARPAIKPVEATATAQGG